MHKAVFLDKDNTIIKDIPYNVDPGLMTLLDNAGEGLRLLKRAGYRLIVVSDQSGVARGYFKEEALGAVKEKLQGLLAPFGAVLDGFYYCPHLPPPQGVVHPYDIKCDCRKPEAGMIFNAAKDLDIDLSRSWMVGDVLKDVEAGNRAGIRTVLVDNGGETEWKWENVSRRPDFVVSDLLQAAQTILAYQIKAETI